MLALLLYITFVLLPLHVKVIGCRDIFRRSAIDKRYLLKRFQLNISVISFDLIAVNIHRHIHSGYRIKEAASVMSIIPYIKKLSKREVPCLWGLYVN